VSRRLTTVEWKANSLILIDQRALPQSFETLEITSLPELVEAIQTLAVRGAPALGAAGAYGVALVLRDCRDVGEFEHRIWILREARPTAVNLAWGVDRVVRSVSPHVAAGHWDLAYEEAVRESGLIATEDIAANAAKSSPTAIRGTLQPYPVARHLVSSGARTNWGARSTSSLTRLGLDSRDFVSPRGNSGAQAFRSR